MKKSAFVRILLGMACMVVLLGHAGRFWQIPFVNLLDNYFYDVRVRAFMPGTLDERIVIIDIDEKSLGALGHWPWSRNTMAQLLRRLIDEDGASVVGFDIVFAEPDGSSGLAVLEDVARGELRHDPAYQQVLRQLQPRLDYDALFADALRGRPVALGVYFSNQIDARKGGALPPPVFPPGQFAGYPEQFAPWAGFGGNLALFQQAAASGGHFNLLADADGSVRRIPLFINHDGAYYEALSLAVVRTLLAKSRLKTGPDVPGAPIEWVDIVGAHNALRIPVDGDAAALVPYRGPERSFAYISALDVLQNRVDADRLRGRIVLVGTSAPGLNDLRTTPVGGSYSGVEIHANLIAGILDGTIKNKPAYVMVLDMLGLLLAGGVLTLLLPRLSPLRGTALAATTLLAALAVNLGVWVGLNAVAPFAATALALAFIYAMNTAWGFFAENHIKRQLTERFGQYVPPELVEEMAKDPEKYSMEGRNAQLTVLFSDVRGFTSIAEKLEPNELASLMNEYLGRMTAVIRQHQGTLDKYIGDAIMAFWGAPMADPLHARNAVLAALEMQAALAGLEALFKARGWPVLKIGIGINTGKMTVGDMGSPVRLSYTVMGDAVNLGARLEGITKEYGVPIAVGEATRQQCAGIAFRELDTIRVKGKAQPVTIYEPLGAAEALPPGAGAELEQWHQALALYRQQAWDAAQTLLTRLHEAAAAAQGEGALYRLYLARIAAWRLNPPAHGWDGVTNFKTK